MKKLSIEELKKLFLSAAHKKHHKIVFQENPYPYEIVAVCEWCGQSAQLDRKKYDRYVWSPWWGNLLSDKLGHLIEEEPHIDEDCWGYEDAIKKQKKELKRKEDFKRIAENIVKDPNPEKIIKILEDVYQQSLKSDEEFMNDVDDYTSQWGSAGPDCCTMQG